MNGAPGMRTPGISAEVAQPSPICQWARNGSVIASRRSPSPGMIALKATGCAMMSFDLEDVAGWGPLDKDRSRQWMYGADIERRKIGDRRTRLELGALESPGSQTGRAGDVTLVEFFDYRCPYCKQLQPPRSGSLATLALVEARCVGVSQNRQPLGARDRTREQPRPTPPRIWSGSMNSLFTSSAPRLIAGAVTMGAPEYHPAAPTPSPVAALVAGIKNQEQQEAVKSGWRAYSALRNCIIAQYRKRSIHFLRQPRNHLP
jgi:hypothetical protein